MNDDEKYMSMALEKARSGCEQGNTPFGACIVKDVKLVSCEHNMVWQNTDITAHAEITAIRKACEKLDTIDLSGCVIYSTTEPCPMCFAACHWAKITKIVYGASIADAQQAGFSELTISNEQMKSIGSSGIEIVSHLMRDENVRLFETWSQRPDKKTY